MATKKFPVLLVATLAAVLSFGVRAEGRVESEGICFTPADWIGKYPAETTRGQGSFLDLPCIKKSLLNLLPAREYKSVRTELAVDAPIGKVDRFLIVSRCQAHNCPSYHAMVIVDTESADMVVGVYQRNSSTARTIWYSTRTDPLELPKEVLERFLRRHVPK